MSNNGQADSARTGGTLIEVALAVVVLAVLAIGAGALYSQSAGQMSIQRDKRAALVAANARMEAIRASNYSSIEPPKDYKTYYLAGNSGAWVHAQTDPGETVTINGRAQPITTTVAYQDMAPAGAGTPVYCLAVRVAVAYRLATPGDRVILDTLLSQ